jgi:hypothetical protein
MQHGQDGIPDCFGREVGAACLPADAGERGIRLIALARVLLGSWRDRDLENAVTLVGNEVTSLLDVVQLEPLRDHRAEVHPTS